MQPVLCAGTYTVLSMTSPLVLTQQRQLYLQPQPVCTQGQNLHPQPVNIPMMQILQLCVPKRLSAAVKFSSPLSDVIFFPEPSGKLPCRCAVSQATICADALRQTDINV